MAQKVPRVDPLFSKINYFSPRITVSLLIILSSKLIICDPMKDSTFSFWNLFPPYVVKISTLITYKYIPCLIFQMVMFVCFPQLFLRLPSVIRRLKYRCADSRSIIMSNYMFFPAAIIFISGCSPNCWLGLFTLAATY